MTACHVCAAAVMSWAAGTAWHLWSPLVTSGHLQSWPPTVPTSTYLLEELRRGGGVLHREPHFPAAALQFHYHLLNLKINKAKK